MTGIPHQSVGESGSGATAQLLRSLQVGTGAELPPVEGVAEGDVARGQVEAAPSAAATMENGSPVPPAEQPAAVGPAAQPAPMAQAERGRSIWLDRWLVRAILRGLGQPPIAVRLWSGEVISPPGVSAQATIEVQDRPTLLRIAWQRELGFGEAYVDGRIRVAQDLVRLLECVGRCAVEQRHAMMPSVLGRLGQGWIRWWRRNTPARSRRNVHHHYDLGNDFYQLWLDEQLVYTCAYFPSPDCSLEQAQRAKLEHVCRKLRLQPGESVVEAGCGWGALALHMARRYGVRVRAYNLSHEQIVYAREQARRQGLQHQVEFIEDDYRAIEGKYDVFVSVGMLEHVGRAQYAALGRTIDRVLLPHGRGLLHSIGRNRPQETDRWTARYVFPGGYAPSLREMLSVLEPRGFSVLDVENLRLHYARTLWHWLERFEAAADRVRQMFDERFVRLWRLYLAGSAAAFTAGSLQLFQVHFARPTLNDVAWTRAHLYVDHPTSGGAPCTGAMC